MKTAPAGYLAWAPWGIALGGTPERAMSNVWRTRPLRGARRAHIWLFRRAAPVLTFTTRRPKLID